MASGTLEKQTAGNGVSVETARPARTYRPPVDIIERGDELMILADMPGVPADQLEIQFEDGMLTILADEQLSAELREHPKLTVAAATA